MLYRPEIQTNSPNLQLPVMKGNTSQQIPNAFSQPRKCIPRTSESLQFSPIGHQQGSSQTPLRKWVETSFAPLHLHELDLNYRVRFTFYLTS
jgi:hypothetical protein